MQVLSICDHLVERVHDAGASLQALWWPQTVVELAEHAWIQRGSNCTLEHEEAGKRVRVAGEPGLEKKWRRILCARQI